MPAPTITRCREFIPNAPSGDDTVIQHLIDASYSFVQSWLDKPLDLATFDELYNGFGKSTFLLNQYPVVSVARVGLWPTQVLSLRNTNTAVSRATVQVTSTGLTLVSVASAVTTTTVLPFATYPTIASMASAISAVSGWTATALNYPTWASADLRAIQGALSAKFQVSLTLHTQEATDFQVDPQLGELYRPGGWPRGYENIRVVYQAGYTSLPPELEQATCELAANAYNARKLNSQMAGENFGGYSYTTAVQESFGNLSITARLALERNKARRVPQYFPR